jgi:DNA polymerase III alpha subunit
VDGVLRDTYGVMLYEDDVLLLAAAMLGVGSGEADRFRKAVQKCPGDAAREALSREFLTRCRRRHLPDAYVRDIWTQMAKFNAYSFCRAHAASYAVLSYAGAYLRAHFPREFWLAALNNNQSMYPVRVYVEQAKRAGVRFLLPDVNRSEAEFTLDGEAVRVGLGRVDSIGPAAVERIRAARARRPFASVSDFLTRTRLGRTETRALVLCGAFETLGRSRPGAMMELNLCKRTLHASASGSMAPTGPGLLAPVATLPEADADYSRTRKIRDEWHILGLSVREHPMALARSRVAQLVDADSRDLPAAVGRRVRIAGLLEARRTTETARGERMGFLTFDDEFGLFEVTVFPDAQQAVGPLGAYGPYVIAGRVESQYDEITITAESVRPTRGA